MKQVWLRLMTLVRGPTAAAKAPTTSSTVRAVGLRGTSLMRMPARFSLSFQGPMWPGCSRLDIRTSSPGARSRPLTTRFRPSVVLLVRATSSGEAPTKAASLVRTDSRMLGRKL